MVFLAFSHTLDNDHVKGSFIFFAKNIKVMVISHKLDNDHVKGSFIFFAKNIKVMVISCGKNVPTF